MPLSFFFFKLFLSLSFAPSFILKLRTTTNSIVHPLVRFDISATVVQDSCSSSGFFSWETFALCNHSAFDNSGVILEFKKFTGQCLWLPVLSWDSLFTVECLVVSGCFCALVLIGIPDDLFLLAQGYTLFPSHMAAKGSPQGDEPLPGELLLKFSSTAPRSCHPVFLHYIFFL